MPFIVTDPPVSTSVERPHFKSPFQRDPITGKVQVVEQGTDEHVASCIGSIVACPAGFRVERPEFGWPFPTFQTQPLDLTALTAALRTFEPRTQATAHEVLTDAQAAIERMATGEALVEVDIPAQPTEGLPDG